MAGAVAYRETHAAGNRANSRGCQAPSFRFSSWGQIRPQDALSVPQSPFDQEIVLHGSRTSAISMSSLRFILPSDIYFGYGVACPALVHDRRSIQLPSVQQH
jgi:hypothetical protein